MYVKDEKKFEDVLIQLRLITPQQLDSLKNESIEAGKSLENLLKTRSYVSEEELVKVKAISLGIPYVDLTSQKVDPNVLRYVPKEYAAEHHIVPFGKTNEKINLAMVDPNDVQAIDYVEKKSGLRVSSYMASLGSIESILDQYADFSKDVQEAIQGMEVISESESEEKEKEETGLGIKAFVQDAPVTRAVNTILEYAAKSRASDIHVEPRERTVKIRYRIDGVLQEKMTLPKHIHPAVVSRIKILSNLKIDEHRIPQDGRFQIKVKDKEIDLRISISPIVFGEKVVIRLLDKSQNLFTLEELGLRGRAFKLIEEATKKPHGMILSTGPTGSGKSTTLYAVLLKINSPEVNIITLEDPVEYEVEGINQIHVNPKVGLTFASGLRSILRQDPDIIMVGEIRDQETADLAVQSALTGHMVLSTLHTNSASGVLPRLLDMEIEPFLIASTVNVVIGQRLVRKICPKCKESYKASESTYTAIKESLSTFLPSQKDPGNNEKIIENSGYKNLPFSEENSYTLYRGKGCRDCNGTGYFGRIGIFEVFSMNPTMESLLLKHATSLEVQDTAVKEGMITMKQDGYFKVLEGITTIEEVARVAQD